MIDYLLNFQTEAAAQADPIVGAYWLAGANGNPGSWRGDVCIANVEVWSPAQDAPGTPTTRPGGRTIVAAPVHSYLPGWFIWISSAAASAALASHPALEISADSEIADSGAPAAQYVTYSKQPLATVLSFMLSNMFAGRKYQFGQ